MPTSDSYDPFSGEVVNTAPKTKEAKKPQGLVPGKWIVFKPSTAKVPKAAAKLTAKSKRAREAEVKEAEEKEALSDEAWREEQNITVSENCPAPMRSFTQLPRIANNEILESFKTSGFTAPTPVQAQAWPILLGGRDMVGIAKTGSGKTLAFMVPAISLLTKLPPLKVDAGPHILVLAPTRELAQQIVDETNKVLPKTYSIVCVYGGTPKRPQLEALSLGADILVATPGRLIDFLDGKKLVVSSARYVVLDEADRMLDMGFEPQVRQICERLPSERQTLMFSATWPKEIQDLASKYQSDIVKVNIGSTKLMANPDIKQSFIFCEERDKTSELRRVIACRPGIRGIIFVNQKITADAVDRELRKAGVDSQAIHGDKDQTQRDYILHRFRTAKAGMLIATDVAARGIDVKGLELVVNYDFPSSLDDYVHRIGRTGRAGSKGTAIALVGHRDKQLTGLVASRLVGLLEQAGQVVPNEIREKAQYATSKLAAAPVKIRPNGAIVPYKHKSKPSLGQKVKKPKQLFGRSLQ